MSELRAPDPTLTAWQGDQFSRRTVEVVKGEPPVAHCGKDSVCVLHGKLGSLMGADRARWFAVPCRECFPDAPPPGHKASCPPGCQVPPGFRPLAWQVQI